MLQFENIMKQNKLLHVNSNCAKSFSECTRSWIEWGGFRGAKTAVNVILVKSKTSHSDRASSIAQYSKLIQK